jgi:PepSY-associated TM region
LASWQKGQESRDTVALKRRSSRDIVLKKLLIFVHRWLGVALCLLFAMWFASGIVMMYWDFPSVTPQDRLDRSPALDASTIRLSPAEAFANLKLDRPPLQARLNIFDGRPVYRFRVGRGESVIFADTGDQVGEPLMSTIERAAASWTGKPIAAAKAESRREVDQWTVQGPLRNLRPFWKYSWPDGQQVYVSGLTGEVVQYTTTSSRLWAYLGPIPHWLYFTPLRKHQSQWSAVVIWSSGIATVTAMFGIVLGAWMYLPRKQVPYRGQKRWHMIFGLIFGLAAVTWAFSGMLSMDPFPANGGRSRNQPNIAAALRGRLNVATFDAKPPIPQPGIQELELLSFAEEPFYLATLAGGGTAVIPAHARPPRELAGQFAKSFDRSEIIRRIRDSVGVKADITVMEDYDAYYLDRRHKKPLPVVLVKLNDPEDSRYYVDPVTARVVGGYGARNWTSRWLYHGLHSFDFPWLYKHRPLWDIVVVSMMLGGSALCLTSLILAWRVLWKKLLLASPRS